MVNVRPYPVNYQQVTIGVVFLLLGFCIYIFDRNFIPLLAIPVDHYINVPFRITGSFSDFIPSFIHPLAFCLLCAGVLGSRKGVSAIICLIWGGLHIILEIGQAQSIYSWISPIFNAIGRDNILPQYIAHYFKTGTFDLMDLLAAVIGCLVAFYLITVTQYKSIGHVFANAKGGPQ